MNVYLSGHSTEQLQAILDKAPKFAKYYMHDKNLHGDIGFYSEKFVIGHHNKATSFKLEDIVEELNNRKKDVEVFADALEKQEFVELPDFSNSISDEMKSQACVWTENSGGDLLQEEFREVSGDECPMFHMLIM